MTIVIIFLTVSFAAGVYYYNQLIRRKQLLEEAQSGVDVHLKRRHDLVPNLIEVAKGYMAHERNTLESVTRLRQEAIGITKLDARAGVENQLTQGLRSVFVLAENYPQLKADGQFQSLHKNLVLIEDELQLARRYYNGTVRDFNVLVQSFPSNFVANAFHFHPQAFFEIETATERLAPEVRI